MRIFVYILIICPILVVSTSSCTRSDKVRIRVLAPMNETKQDLSLINDNLSTSPKINLSDPNTSGNSIYLVLGIIAFGNTTLNTSLKKETKKKSDDTLMIKETTSIKARYNDLAFVFGENYTLMFGFGAFGGGDIQTKLEYGSIGAYDSSTDETVKSNYIGGLSTFAVFGFNVRGFETLIGMRNNEIKAELNSKGTSARTLHNNGTIELKDKGIHLKTSQVTLGFGYTF